MKKSAAITLRRLLLNPAQNTNTILKPAMRGFGGRLAGSTANYIDDSEFLPERIVQEQEMQMKFDSSVIVTHRPDNMLKHDEVSEIQSRAILAVAAIFLNSY